MTRTQKSLEQNITESDTDQTDRKSMKGSLSPTLDQSTIKSLGAIKALNQYPTLALGSGAVHQTSKCSVRLIAS